ncbi:hypothetical protein BU16DRAFT_439671, partial [Lophium mytilinum]
KAVGDSSTIDFAYLPESENDVRSEVPATRISLLLSTMYSGVTARAMHEETPEQTLRPMINLISGSETYINASSAMSEVTDNTSIMFEGIQANSSSGNARQEIENTAAGAVKQFFNGLLDDIIGPKR